jgi:hypothetical protein
LTITEKTSIAEVAAEVSEALKKSGIDAVLSGGAVVSVYTHNEYESYDLDFIVRSLDKSNLAKALLPIGFIKTKERYYKHPLSPFFVEFPKGPLMIGSSHITNIAEFQTNSGSIRILPPTESVMDRLSAFYHWNDEQCLDQAIMIVKKQKVDMRAVEKWSKKENKIKEFEIFSSKLSIK